MTPQETIEEARIPGTNSVLVLGSFEKRVTVYSQQVRALNLVDAILSENLVRPNGGKVAIVGGGAAGITAAVALARTNPNLERLDLFERNSAVLSLQHGSRRFLHPHFYDWPAADSDRNDAGLPLMNWTAGAAGDVAATLRAEFDAECHKTILTLYSDQAVTGLIPSSLGPIRVVVDKSTAIARIYDVVILAIGFGLESYLDGETLSYWSPSALAGPIHTQVANPILFISGNGDGGLVDFMMAAFNALEHHQICAMLMGLDLGAARAEIETIEQEAWAPGATVDLLAEYRARLRPLIPLAVWQEIAGQLRPAMLIHFHTRDAQLLRRTTALHNRLAVYLILEADLELGRNAITVTTNAEFDGPIPKRGEVRIVGHDAFDPLRRFLRLGPDAASNLKPFQDLLDHYPGAINAPRSATRPESPTLTASAQARFTALQPAPAPAPAPAAAPVAAAPVVNAATLTLSLAAPGHVAWSGDLDPGAIGQVWSANRTLSLYCDIPTAEIAVLAPVIARLGAHATGFMLHTTHSGWRTTLGALCGGKVLPGPDLDIRCFVSDLQIAPALGQMTQYSIATLAATIDEQLDGEVLRQLHVALHEILGPAAAQIGWPIEPALRAKLWDLWQQWYFALEADSAKCRRYLRLLVSEKDREIPDEAALVGIGPKTVRPFMTKSTIFALAFAACSGLVLSPAAQRPGNIASEALTAHSCGISWINERMLGTRAAMEQGWTTGVVLLSQLRQAALMMEGDLRMDRNFSDAASVGRISPAEDPLVIGADDVFITALEAGEATMREYLRSIFEWRSRAAAQMLEDANNDAA